MQLQTVPNSFFLIVFLMGVLCAGSGRTWELVLAWHKNLPPDLTQRKRFYVTWQGICISVIALAALLGFYSPAEVIHDLLVVTRYTGPLGLVMWIVVLTHVVTVIALPIIDVAYRRKPIVHGQIDMSDLTDVRNRQMMS